MTFDYRKAFPLVDFNQEYDFTACLNREDFLIKCVNIYFSSVDLREKESALAVYMAIRDHYPTILNCLATDTLKTLDLELEKSSPKIIKLRRLVLSALSKAG